MSGTKIPVDGQIAHTHELSEGYQEGCPACEREVDLTAGDLVVQLGVMIDPSFDQARTDIERAMKLITRAKNQLGHPLEFLNTAKVSDAVLHLDSSMEALSQIYARFPRPSRARIVQPLEFVMACYAEIYSSIPDASFKKDGGQEMPLGPGPRFISHVWQRAHETIKEAKDLKIEPRGSDGKPLKRAAFLTGDFRKTMQEILRRWGGTPPNPRDLSPLDGDEGVWLG